MSSPWSTLTGSLTPPSPRSSRPSSTQPLSRRAPVGRRRRPLDVARLRHLGNRIGGLVDIRRTRVFRSCYGLQRFSERATSPCSASKFESDVPASSGTRLWWDGFEAEPLINIRIAQARLEVSKVTSLSTSRFHVTT